MLFQLLLGFLSSEILTAPTAVVEVVVVVKGANHEKVSLEIGMTGSCFN